MIGLLLKRQKLRATRRLLAGVPRSHQTNQPNRNNWINYPKVNELGQYHATKMMSPLLIQTWPPRPP